MSTNEKIEIDMEDVYTLEKTLLQTLLNYGEILHCIEHSGKYLDWGFPTFKNFVRNCNVGRDVAMFAHAFCGLHLSIESLRNKKDAVLSEIKKAKPFSEN